MPPPFKILMIALFAFGWNSLAAAESPTSDPTRAAVPTVIDLSLDTAFEQATSPKTEPNELAGPTIMDCKNDSDADGPEVCVVTVDGLFASMSATMPAARATH